MTRSAETCRRRCGAGFCEPVDLDAQTAEPPARIRDAFDFGWKFTRGDVPGAQQPAFADAGWRSLDLPHDWSIEGPFAQNEPSGGAGANAPTGIGWYRKRFRVPASYKDRKVSIEFDGVYQNSEVWINGHYLGKRPFGYISFAYDITPAPELERRERGGREGGQLAPARLAMVLRLGHLPAHLADRGQPHARGALGNLRDHAPSD